MKKINLFLFVALIVLPGLLIAQAPVADFSPLKDSTCGNSFTENFMDMSTNSPTSWKWYFPGATPDTSTLRNPTNIVYNGYGCYTVKLVVKNNIGSDSLTDSDAICLDVKPQVKITGGEICQFSSGRDSIVITALNFVWPDGKTDSIIYINAIISKTYTIQIRNGACFLDTSFTVTVDTMPSVKFKGDTSVCVGDSTIIYALDNKGFPGYGYNYLWSTGSTADSIVVKGITPGLYTYYLTVTKGGCSKDSSEIKVRVHYCVGGVKTYFNPLDVGIFPNPATNQLSITTDNPFGSNAVLTISDVTGRIVQKETITANQSKFNTDISSLAPSIYFLKIQTDRGIAVKKFVKE